MSISIEAVELNVLNMKTRMPFRYGIASLEALPHLFVRVDASIDGSSEIGLAADGLPPKWFTKHPDTLFAEDLGGMLAVIRKACELSLQVDKADSVFDFWHALHRMQEGWAAATPYPPLLWGFGVSLVDRALIDAFCRRAGKPFSALLSENAFGIRLGDLHPELEGKVPGDLLPDTPGSRIAARHTVGLTDPLTDEEISPDERLSDGLPQSLEANIDAYGLTHLKIKLMGDVEKDLARLERIADLVAGHVTTDYGFTLDGNEQYTEVAPFRSVWEAIQTDAQLAPFLKHLLFVEQPFRRDVALSPTVTDALLAWRDRPTLIIDESGSRLEMARQALECGYSGTSHKNCKGVFKGIANACLMAYRARQSPDGHFVLSSEDLANLAPVALLQDLAVVAAMGVTHCERNAHHYFLGLSMFPDGVQEKVLAHHGSLYRRHPAGFPTLDIRQGSLALDSVNRAPFGYGFELDTRQFTPLDDWSADSLDG